MKYIWIVIIATQYTIQKQCPYAMPQDNMFRVPPHTYPEVHYKDTIAYFSSSKKAWNYVYKNLPNSITIDSIIVK